MMHEDLVGTRALVTGGTRGAGTAVARRLRAAGADVTVTARSMPDDDADPPRFVAADVSTPDGVAAVVHAVERDRLGDHRCGACHRRWHRADRLICPAPHPHRPARPTVTESGDMMTTTDTPDIVHRYFELASSRKSEEYLALFAEDAVVEDEGTTYSGIAAISAWHSGTPAVTYTITDIERSPRGVTATCTIAGDFPGSPFGGLRFHFEDVDGEHLKILRIRPKAG